MAKPMDGGGSPGRNRSPLIVRIVGIALLLLGAACGVIAIAALRGWIFGSVSTDGTRSATWPEGFLTMLAGGLASIAFLLLGIILWVSGTIASKTPRG